jgi:hypothetical protein
MIVVLCLHTGSHWFVDCVRATRYLVPGTFSFTFSLCLFCFPYVLQYWSGRFLFIYIYILQNSDTAGKLLPSRDPITLRFCQIESDKR